jgi:hypothetical protein
MTIHFTKQDEQVIREALTSADLDATAANAAKLLSALRAAFRQQFAYEANYLATSMADEELAE